MTTERPSPPGVGGDITMSTSSSSSSPISVTATPNHAVVPIDLNERKPSKSGNDERWCCRASAKSLRTRNPIREIVDPIVQNIKLGSERADGKDPISLALGDPTAGGSLPPCEPALNAVMKSLQQKPHAAGYINACGLPEARVAIAEAHSYPEHSISAENVVIANGCSGALELALTAILDSGTAVLVPKPGFPLYQVIAESHGASVVQYNLRPDRGWECDLDHLEQLLQESSSKHPIRCLLLNNPSNPTGGVFSEDHLQELIHFADRHKLPIIADEVYGDLVFDDEESSQTSLFHPCAQVAAKLGRTVPVITVSGLAKQYLLPGWRVGWLTFHDNIFGSLSAQGGGVEAGVKRLAQVILGASHLPQTAIPALLSSQSSEELSSSYAVVQEWKLELRTRLRRQARYLEHRLNEAPGLEVIPSRGAMYAIVRLDMDMLDVKDDLEFSKQLLEEENVFVLPGSAFGIHNNMFRVVFCAAEPVLEIAAQRITQFCVNHSSK